MERACALHYDQVDISCLSIKVFDVRADSRPELSCSKDGGSWSLGTRSTAALPVRTVYKQRRWPAPPERRSPPSASPAAPRRPADSSAPRPPSAGTPGSPGLRLKAHRGHLGGNPDSETALQPPYCCDVAFSSSSSLNGGKHSSREEHDCPLLVKTRYCRHVLKKIFENKITFSYIL